MWNGERGGDAQAGYTLVGLLVAIAVVNIVLGAVVASWTTIDRRAREAEAIWRGQQIARAIACYGGTSPTEPLTRLEQLVESNCLRRLYDDPLVKDGQWRVLTEQDVADGTVAALLGEPAPEDAEPGAAPGVAAGAAPGQAGLGTAAGGLGLSRLFQGNRSFGPSLSATGNGIVGVASKAGGEALREYRGRQKYSEWAFLPGGGSEG